MVINRQFNVEFKILSWAIGIEWISQFLHLEHCSTWFLPFEAPLVKVLRFSHTLTVKRPEYGTKPIELTWKSSPPTTRRRSLRHSQFLIRFTPFFNPPNPAPGGQPARTKNAKIPTTTRRPGPAESGTPKLKYIHAPFWERPTPPLPSQKSLWEYNRHGPSSWKPKCLPSASPPMCAGEMPSDSGTIQLHVALPMTWQPHS